MAQAEHVITAIPAPVTCEGAKTPTNLVQAAHATLVSALAGNAPRRIPLDTRPLDLEDRAEHLDKLLKAVSVYLTELLEDTGENVPGGLELRYIKAALSDLASDAVGTVRRAAEDLSGRFA